MKILKNIALITLTSSLFAPSGYGYGNPIETCLDFVDSSDDVKNVFHCSEVVNTYEFDQKKLESGKISYPFICGYRFKSDNSLLFNDLGNSFLAVDFYGKDVLEFEDFHVLFIERYSTSALGRKRTAGVEVLGKWGNNFTINYTLNRNTLTSKEIAVDVDLNCISMN